MSANPTRQAGPSNPNWRGGRSIASNGYVLVKVGKGHHLADVRGYAYEHRLVAEEKLGRRLMPSEVPHHINGIKTDNRPENLEVVSRSEHGHHHRKSDRGLRNPGEANPEIACACGCGETLLRFDGTRRPRAYITGHNRQPSEARDAIEAVLAGGPLHRSEIARRLGKSDAVVATTLSRLKAEGRARSDGGGVWGPV